MAVANPSLDLETGPSLLRRAACLLVCLATLLFSACATKPPRDDAARAAYWQQHREKLSDLITWQLQGRIAIHVNKEAWSASLHWRQDRNAYRLRIIAPLGQGSYELSGGEQGVYMRTAANEVLYADDAETLLRENLGWAIPLGGLAYWIKGLPEPGIETEMLQLDEKGRITGMSQSGWRLSYRRYTHSSGYELPGKIFLENGEVKLRLIIKDWKTAL